MPEQSATIEKEEHSHLTYSKRVSLISSATIYAVVNTAAGGANATVNTISPLEQNPFYTFAQDTAVPFNTETTILNYGINSNTGYLQGLLASGSAEAAFNMKIDGTLQGTGRISTAMRNLSLGFGLVSIGSGSTISVTALHKESANQKMEVSLFGFYR